jgi:hypothetical protein
MQNGAKVMNLSAQVDAGCAFVLVERRVLAYRLVP